MIMKSKVYKRKPDCVHYDGCLTQAAINDSVLKCGGCRRYRFKGLHVDPFVNKEVVIVPTPSAGNFFEDMDLALQGAI